MGTGVSISLDGRTALVAGGAQGIGMAIAHSLAAAGARVHLADRSEIVWPQQGHDPQQAQAPVAAMNRHRCDLAERGAAQALIADITRLDGAPDIVVNAAGGVCGQIGGPLEAVDAAGWRALFAANVETALWLAQAAAPAMRARGRGRLVFISSGAGLRPSLTGIQGYTAAKHALVGLTRQLALELGPDGITCNSVAPGFVRSNPSTERQWQRYGAQGQQRLIEQIHLRRLGSAADIAHAVLFLASDLAGWITGQVLSVDGGRA